MTSVKPNHQANIVRISAILQHTNADNLQLIKIGGYQAVVRKGTFQPGDLGVYIQPDSIVPQTEPFRFIWDTYQTEPDGAVPEKRRRITVRKFRGEWSEGLLLPLSDFGLVTYDACTSPRTGTLTALGRTLTFTEGDDLSEFLGITHYDPDKGKEGTCGESETAPKRSRWPRSFRGWLFFLLSRIGIRIGGDINGWDREYNDLKLPYYDVFAWKNFPAELRDGEDVVITEKVHGSNAKFVYMNGRMYVGSRTLWKSPKSRCIWRKALAQNPWIEEWCRAHKNYTIYGEVVPSQKNFEYGCKSGEVKFVFFDVRTPNNMWLEYGEYAALGLDYVSGQHAVPFLYQGPYSIAKIIELVDGPSYVSGARHIREGIVIKTLKQRYAIGLGRVMLKLVSNQFLERDSK